MSDAIKTRVISVGSGVSDTHSLFSVVPNVELQDALAELSHLLDCAHATALELCDGALPDRRLLGATLHCLEGARALADALTGNT